jgi:FKBP-type peptidyl-prolyl cis-trans isomerase FkpA
MIKSRLRGFVVLVLITSSIAFVSCLNTDDFLTFDEQLELQGKEIDAYLEENNIDAEISPDGLRYVIHNEGSGETPEYLDNVTVNYVGKFLPSEDVFDENDNITFQLTSSGLITAWVIGVPLIKEGGSITIYAPAVYCYGPTGRGTIPPNANLIFDITLIKTEAPS